MLTRYIGWQTIFFLNVPIRAAALYSRRASCRGSHLANMRRRYDPFGAVTVTGGLLLLVYAISKAPQERLVVTRTIALLAGATALLIPFIVTESRSSRR